MLRAFVFAVIANSTLLVAAPQPQSFRQPLVFEPNQGQAAPQVKWLARGNGYQLFLTADGATMVMRDRGTEAPKTSFLAASFSPSGPVSAPTNASPSSVIRMKLNGSRSWDNVNGLEPTGGMSNYLIGNDPKQWHLNIPHYARLQTESVYEGIDLVLYSNGGELEYDFVVAPYADPKQIRLAFDGVDGMRVDGRTGDLLLTVANGVEVRQMRPRVYQRFGNQLVDVAGVYEVLDRKQATFALAAYDAGRPLVIDPTLTFTTFLAGSNTDEAHAVAVDGSANTYVTGHTASIDFPTVSPIQTYQGVGDAFVTKLSSNGTILFSTYLGGNNSDNGQGIAVDSTGIYITGSTTSANFPTHDSISKPGLNKAFVTKLSPDGTTLLYSTLLGGGGNDYSTAIAIDSAGAAYVTGYTTSPNFPMASGVTPLQARIIAPTNAFIAKLSPAGTALEYSTYWGGNAGAVGNGIAVDPSGYVYVTGGVGAHFTSSMRACAATGDTFILKFRPGSVAPTYSTCFGAGSRGNAITADASGDAYVTGMTWDSNFPTTVGALQRATVTITNGNTSGFVAKLNNVGGLTYATYLSGTTAERQAWG
jgi:hypothetical protein